MILLNTSNLTINIIYFVKFKKVDKLYCSLFVLVYGDTTILLSVTKLNLQNLLNVCVYFIFIFWGGGWGVGGFNVSENRKLCDIIPLTGFTCKP